MTIIGCTNIVHRLIEWLSTVTVIFDCDDKFVVDLSSTSRVIIDSEMSRVIVIVVINK